jgi:carbon-monoxide dehydrogenase large subunit
MVRYRENSIRDKTGCADPNPRDKIRNINKGRNMPRFSISQPVNQVEGPRLLKGAGRFTSDITLAHQAHAVFLRSPHAHAEIKSIDTSAAEAMPGVIKVLTGEDYAADELGDMPGERPFKRRDGETMFRPPRPALTRDRVRHVGQPVCVVIAESIDQGKDATEAIEVDYAPLPAHVPTASATDPDTRLLWEDCPNNEAMFVEIGSGAAVDEAFSKSAHVVRDTFIVSRVTANTMEPRAAVADYDSGRDHFTIYACHQRPYVWRTMMTKSVFGIPENQMTIIAGDVGGSFGMKGGLYCEVPVAAWASKKIGRPVKWTCERSEGHVSDYQARDMVVEAELGLDEDGKFTGIRFSSKNNLGAYFSMNGFNSTRGIAASLCGTYHMPAVHGMGAGVFTNSVPTANYRAPGGAPGTFVLERIVDMAARDVGLDPTEIRRRNHIPVEAMPYKLPTGARYDCGEFTALMDKCLGLADYAGAAKRKEKAESQGRLYGVGISTTVDPSAGPSTETAELRFDPGGHVTVLVGSTAGGQSHATIYTQIVSDKLGIDADTIRVVEGDTGRLAWGTGTGAARTATIAGSTVFKATEKIIEKGRRIAAHLLEAEPDEVTFDDGNYLVPGTNRSIGFEDVAKAAFKPKQLPDDVEIGFYETATWSPDANNIPNSCHVVEVDIDPETGILTLERYTAVQDVGVELNPVLVRGQVCGGIAQGAGQALKERMVYDPEDGQLLSGSFMDYAMPRASDFCRINLGSHPVPTEQNPLGVKGAGECGTVGSLSATMNAVNDALAPLGIRNFAMPATPERLWRAIRDAHKAAA